MSIKKERPGKRPLCAKNASFSEGIILYGYW
jgi:hypothetical protein